MEYDNETFMKIYRYLATIQEVRAVDVENFFKGETDLKNVLSKSEFSKLEELKRENK